MSTIKATVKDIPFGTSMKLQGAVIQFEPGMDLGGELELGLTDYPQWYLYDGGNFSAWYHESWLNITEGKSTRFQELIEKMQDIQKRKNAGYAGQGNPDPWANFRMAEMFGVSSFIGCLVRMSDKFIRIANLVKNPKNEQVNESITDTLLDLANYCLIAICLYEEEHKK